MAEDKQQVAEKEVVAEQTPADAPKKNAVAAEPMKSLGSAEDLGPAVVKPTDSNPDATKKMKKVSDQVSATADKGGTPDSSGRPDTQAGTTKVDHPGQSAKVEETKKDGEIVKEGEMPKAALDALNKNKEKKEESADEKSKEKEVAKEDKEVKSDKADDKKELDVKEHVDALIAGENDLSEEFKSKAATIFESAIRSKVKEIAETMEADYESKLQNEIESKKEEITEKVDSYLNYVVEEWMKENSLALERGIKGEIAEDFISGLKKLFEDHYINVPDEKYDVLEAQAKEIDDLKNSLNEQIEKSVELKKSNDVKEKDAIKQEVASDLADTAKEKFNKLSEEIEYSNADDFKKKCETIKESYFGKKAVESLDDVAVTDEASNEDLSNAMAAYSSAISKYKNIKIAK
tara:strand:+ start:1233 stop:2447 length:1215 start_codon:yes stop_codon:yes gene_type:complete